MTTRFMGQWLDGSPEWHHLREGRIGGSDIGAIIGHGYITREELLDQKRAGTDGKDTPALRRGHYAEPYLRAWLAGEKGITVDEARRGTYHGDDWAVINPDDITTDGQLVEYKCHSTRDEFGRAGSAQIPPRHLAQVTWSAGWLGLDRWLLVVHATKVTDRGSTFDDALYKGRFDPNFFDWLCQRARQFHTELHDTGENAA